MIAIRNLQGKRQERNREQAYPPDQVFKITVPWSISSFPDNWFNQQKAKAEASGCSLSSRARRKEPDKPVRYDYQACGPNASIVLKRLIAAMAEHHVEALELAGPDFDRSSTVTAGLTAGGITDEALQQQSMPSAAWAELQAERGPDSRSPLSSPRTCWFPSPQDRGSPGSQGDRDHERLKRTSRPSGPWSGIDMDQEETQGKQMDPREEPRQAHGPRSASCERKVSFNLGCKRGREVVDNRKRSQTCTPTGRNEEPQADEEGRRVQLVSKSPVDKTKVAGPPGLTATEVTVTAAAATAHIPISPMPTRIPRVVLSSKSEAPVAYHADWTEGSSFEETINLRFDRA